MLRFDGFDPSKISLESNRRHRFITNCIFNCEHFTSILNLAQGLRRDLHFPARLSLESVLRIQL